ncbi:SH3 domain-containing protein [Candidatus Poriferisodalis sp.]|uniref:SH3 domain-containing protein n=1 Tax=Candidatus Poriferisodalis sp. TaxID=3101277 RepID=UPI003B017BB9
MTDPTAFPGSPGGGFPPDNGLVAIRDRLPLGISLLALAVAIVALVLAVNGGNDDGTDGTEAETVAGTVTVTAPPPTSVTTSTARTTTTLGTVQTLPPTPTTTTAQQIVTATTTLEAEMTEDEPSPLVLSVVGIGHDSNLNLRNAPEGQVIGRLDSLATGLVPTGTTRSQSGTIWLEVQVEDDVGWVSGEYVAPLGATFDATSQIVAILGESPSAETLTELGRLVAGALASEDPEPRIRISEAPVAGVVSGITMDIVGMPDDSVRGLRLRVFAQASEDGDGYTLRNVEGTVMCFSERGVSAEGLCN